jgi:hypothetical protein
MSNHILRLYNEVFEMPDYDAIEDHGDFKFSIRGYSNSMSSPSRVGATISHVRDAKIWKLTYVVFIRTLQQSN